MTPVLARTYIGNRIKEARLSANITQKQLAEAISVSRRCVISLEAGDRDIRLPMLYEMSKILGVKFISLLPKEYTE